MAVCIAHIGKQATQHRIFSSVPNVSGSSPFVIKSFAPTDLHFSSVIFLHHRSTEPLNVIYVESKKISLINAKYTNVFVDRTICLEILCFICFIRLDIFLNLLNFILHQNRPRSCFYRVNSFKVKHAYLFKKIMKLAQIINSL